MNRLCGSVLAVTVLAPAAAEPQGIAPTRDEVIALTSEWTGERFADGRPRVPDAVLDRMARIGLEEAWAVLRNKGFEWQYEGRFKLVHLDETATMVGRALTATFVPKRPDLDTALSARGPRRGTHRRAQVGLRDVPGLGVEINEDAMRKYAPKDVPFFA